MYDNEDVVCGIIYNGAPYYFEKNLQGDVISIVDANSTLVARYTYDAWGVCTDIVDGDGIDIIGNASHIANINPFRYRGYYFDYEIGFYYLQSRYYDASIGRFVNGDDIKFLGSYITNANNLFLYCDNDPINSRDISGFFSLKGLKDVFEKILNWCKNLADALLAFFGISKKNYQKRNKYKTSKDIYDFVFENKKKIKAVSRVSSSITNFLEILTIVCESSKNVKKDGNVDREIASLLFDGLVKLIGSAVGKIVGWLVSKLIWLLRWMKWIIESLFDYLVGMILESSFVDKVKKNYMSNLNTKDFSFGMLLIALFKGIRASL